MHILIGDSNPIKWRCRAGFTCASLKKKGKCNAKWKNVGLTDWCLRFLPKYVQNLRIKTYHCRRTCASCTLGQQRIAPDHEDDTNELGDKPLEIIGNARNKETLNDSIFLNLKYMIMIQGLLFTTCLSAQEKLYNQDL